jgi:thiamine-monophosphate kinase
MLTEKNYKMKGSSKENLLNSVFLPKARLAEGLALGRSGTVSASIDSSDGLAWSLHEIARFSKVGFLLDSIPIADEVTKFAQPNKVDAVDLALYGGEEYEIIATIKPDGWNMAKSAVEEVGGQLLQIGKVTSKPGVILDVGDRRQAIEARGWEHFKSQI